jgi:hypothetical protein
MEILKKTSKPTVIIFFILILVCIILNNNGDYENDYLLLALNSVFLGIIPIMVSVFSACTYIRNNLSQALLMSCGMLVFGLGSIFAACARLLPDSANYTVTTHNLSVCLFSIFNLAAAMTEKPYR